MLSHPYLLSEQFMIGVSYELYSSYSFQGSLNGKLELKMIVLLYRKDLVQVPKQNECYIYPSSIHPSTCRRHGQTDHQTDTLGEI